MEDTKMPTKLHEDVRDAGLARYLTPESSEAPRFIEDLRTYGEDYLDVLLDRAADAHVCGHMEVEPKLECVRDEWSPRECGLVLVASVVVECGPQQ